MELTEVQQGSKDMTRQDKKQRKRYCDGTHWVASAILTGRIIGFLRRRYHRSKTAIVTKSRLEIPATIPPIAPLLNLRNNAGQLKAE